jgi:hypothetical protein
MLGPIVKILFQLATYASGVTREGLIYINNLAIEMDSVHASATLRKA